jgi:putative peptidoglycan lipid II flippase
VLLPGLRKVGFHFRPGLGFWTPKVRRMIRLTIPVALGAGVLQVSVLLDKGIALGLMQRVDAAGHVVPGFHLFGHAIRFPMEFGAPRRLDIAQFMYQFPLGVFAIALATAIFPDLSAEALEKDRDRFRSVLRQGVEATLWEGLPASVGLILVAEPAVRLLFQHGQVTAHDAGLIARSVCWYAGAIWAFSLLQIINRAYYALHDTTTPFRLSVANLLVNLAVEMPLIWWLGEAGMAVGTLVSFALQAAVMLYMLDRRIGGMELGRSLRPVMKMVLATGVMTAVCLLVRKLPLYPAATGRAGWAAQLALTMVVGAGAYLATCAGLGVDTMRQLVPGRKGKAA